ncbi:MAG: hypothetical protein ACQEUZ_04000, partial [Pseudomonadota bacterium]
MLGECATGGSEPAVAVCPPVVEYDPAFLARAAEEVEALPEGSAIAQMLGDYAVMREQGKRPTEDTFYEAGWAHGMSSSMRLWGCPPTMRS